MRARTLIALLASTAAIAWLISGCAVNTPFRRTTHPVDTDHLIVSLTNARLDPDTRDVFDRYTRQTVDSLPQQPGLIGWSVRTRPLGNEVWTMTVWADQDALDQFVTSPTHRAAVRHGMAAVRQFRFHQFTLAPTELPPRWPDALARLETIPFTTNHPPATPTRGPQ